MRPRRLSQLALHREGGSPLGAPPPGGTALFFFRAGAPTRALYFAPGAPTRALYFAPGAPTRALLFGAGAPNPRCLSLAARLFAGLVVAARRGGHEAPLHPFG